MPLHLWNKCSELKDHLGGLFPLSRMKCPFLCLLTNFGLETILLDIKIISQAYFQCKYIGNSFSYPLL